MDEKRSRTRSRAIRMSRWQRGLVLRVGRLRLRRMAVVVGIVGWWSLQWLVYKWMTEIQFEGAKDRFLWRQGLHQGPARPSIRPTSGNNLVLEVEA